MIGPWCGWERRPLVAHWLWLQVLLLFFNVLMLNKDWDLPQLHSVFGNFRFWLQNIWVLIEAEMKASGDSVVQVLEVLIRGSRVHSHQTTATKPLLRTRPQLTHDKGVISIMIQWMFHMKTSWCMDCGCGVRWGESIQDPDLGLTSPKTQSSGVFLWVCMIAMLEKPDQFTAPSGDVSAVQQFIKPNSLCLSLSLYASLSFSLSFSLALLYLSGSLGWTRFWRIFHRTFMSLPDQQDEESFHFLKVQVLGAGSNSHAENKSAG